ncbi:ribonucleotide reductase of class iii (anaerobic), activating protein [hydrocarbon metagenome]|uniref:Ribonucleotide reductase of class iii (Anaerobic), activating protein n=1 Tax=hydrocarbon metagenome TaxID=938273 RepID=A0A0W8E751_9ZZZZ
MKFAGMIKQSLVDYPGKIAAVLFARGCNFCCPFCHNGHLLIKPGKAGAEYINMQEILDFLRERKGFLDAVVISGGEPCLNLELPEALSKIKDIGYLTKLDTNGSRTSMLSQLGESLLLDYVAMDIKGVLDYKRYLEACGGRLSTEDFFNVKGSINLLKNADMEVEFRTTVVPGLHKAEDIIEIARYIEGASKYSLQQFNPRDTINPDYYHIKPYAREELMAMAEGCRKYVKEVRLLNV